MTGPGAGGLCYPSADECRSSCECASRGLEPFLYRLRSTTPESPSALLAGTVHVWPKAERAAAKIFVRARIGIEWVECPIPTSMEESINYLACQSDQGQAGFTIGILSQFKIERTSVHTGSLGFAYLGIAMAHVSFYRVRHLAQFGYPSEAEVLSHAIAPEIGHLLPGSKRPFSHRHHAGQLGTDRVETGCRRRALF